MRIAFQRKLVRKQIQNLRNAELKAAMLHWFKEQKDTTEFPINLILDKIRLSGKYSCFETYQENLHIFTYEYGRRKFENYKRALDLLDIKIEDNKILEFVQNIQWNNK